MLAFRQPRIVNGKQLSPQLNQRLSPVSVAMLQAAYVAIDSGH
jgi:hypothetical protein